MAGIRSKRWNVANHIEYFRTIKDAFKRKEKLSAMGYLILGEETGMDDEGPWICVQAKKPGTWKDN